MQASFNQPVNDDNTSLHVNNQPMASMQVIYDVIYFVGISCQSALKAMVKWILSQLSGSQVGWLHVGWLLSSVTSHEVDC